MRPNSHVYNQPVADLSVIACAHCDLLQRLPERRAGRVSALRALRRGVMASPRGFAQPDVRADAGGRGALRGRELRSDAGAHDRRARGLDHGYRRRRHLWADGRETVAVLVLFTAVVAPALQIGFMLAIVLGARREPSPRWAGMLLRHHRTTRTWSMIEVMMLGVLVALIKIADYATVFRGLRCSCSAAGLSARGDAGELRSARGVEPHRVGGGRRAARCRHDGRGEA